MWPMAVPAIPRTLTIALLCVVLFATIARAESTSCSPAPSGLVSWWSAEGNACDTFGSNPGTAIGSVHSAAGKVGQAFSFYGPYYIPLLTAEPFDFGAGPYYIAVCINNP